MRADPIPCPICGADIDPQLIENEHALFGTEIQKILDAIPQWGCFAIPGWTHSPWEWADGAEAAKIIYKAFEGHIDLVGVQHAWKQSREYLPKKYTPYCWVPERLRQVTLSPITR